MVEIMIKSNPQEARVALSSREEFFAEIASETDDTGIARFNTIFDTMLALHLSSTLALDGSGDNDFIFHACMDEEEAVGTASMYEITL